MVDGLEMVAILRGAFQHFIAILFIENTGTKGLWGHAERCIPESTIIAWECCLSANVVVLCCLFVRRRVRIERIIGTLINGD